MRCTILLATLFVALILPGCEKSNEPTGGAKTPAPTLSTPPKDEHQHESEAGGHGGHGGEVIELGVTQAGDFTVQASRDKGVIKPGGDVPIDVWIDGGVGKGVTAVRFWIGTEDAKGSIKAKADIEDGKWHTHAEVPDPMPSTGKLWIEIEHSGGKTVAEFDLKN